MWNSAVMCLDKKYWSARHTDEDSTEYERSTRVAICTKYTVLKGNDGMTWILFQVTQAPSTDFFYPWKSTCLWTNLSSTTFTHTRGRARTHAHAYIHTHFCSSEPKTPWSTTSCNNPIFNPHLRHHLEIKRALKNKWKQNVQIQLSMQYKTNETQLIKIKQII
jgi:hypothetical protein